MCLKDYVEAASVNQFIIEAVGRTLNRRFMKVQNIVLERKISKIQDKCLKCQDNIEHIKKVSLFVLLLSGQTFYHFSSNE